MAEPSLRDRLLIALRARDWRSYRQLCLHICGRSDHPEVEAELDRLRHEGLVDFFDDTKRRYCLTKCAGLNAARDAWKRKQRREAA